VDPEGVYRAEVDGEPARDLLPRTVRSIQALLSKKPAIQAVPGRRTPTPGVLRFLDLEITGEQTRFVERRIRITQLPPAEAGPAKAAILAASPPRTGRVV
jgi:hypothetical protein